jgi:hypothetical protein
VGYPKRTSKQQKKLINDAKRCQGIGKQVEKMTEYKFQNATIRIHGSVNLEGLKTATERFMKKALIEKRKTQSGRG